MNLHFQSTEDPSSSLVLIQSNLLRDFDSQNQEYITVVQTLNKPNLQNPQFASAALTHSRF
ncbi:hypothetical protein AALP_AA4G103900 [Arabis alpina]|uniref:Uncharacterized protein n=1 Tax=Arabis alpina TaxID=50452 RepID=A0A087H2E4_ARAAL|nr:hypothetical protein AALP_AA4G103900 [Arabis alpina]